MLALANMLYGIGYVLDSLLSFFAILIIVRVVLSWVNADPYNMIVRIVMQTTDPVLKLFGRWRLHFGGLDFTPIVVLLLIGFLRYALVQTIYDYAVVLRGASV